MVGGVHGGIQGKHTLSITVECGVTLGGNHPVLGEDKDEGKPLHSCWQLKGNW